MRTTLNIADELLSEAKLVAARTGRTLTSVIEDALRQSLRSRPKARDLVTVRLPTFKGTGVRPGIDLDDNSALLDVMEGLDVPS